MSADVGNVKVVSVESVDGDPDGGCVGSGMCTGSVSIASRSTKQSHTLKWNFKKNGDTFYITQVSGFNRN